MTSLTAALSTSISFPKHGNVFPKHGMYFRTRRSHFGCSVLKQIKQTSFSFSRDFNHSIQQFFVINKNVRCSIKTEILSDKSEHSVEVDSIDGQKFLFKCGNLTQLELLHLFNQHITPLAPPEEAEDIKIPAKLMKKKK